MTSSSGIELVSTGPSPGGLQRAYSDAVNAVVKECQTTQVLPQVQALLTLDYADEALVRHSLGEFDGSLDDIDYQQRVVVTVSVRRDCWADLVEALTNRSAGRCIIETLGSSD